MLIKYLLSGKEIDLTSNSTTIKSDNFTVDKNGNMTCSNVDITGGQISLKSDEQKSMLEVINKDNSNHFTKIFPTHVVCTSDGNDVSIGSTLGYGMIAMNYDGVSKVGIIGKSSNPNIFLQNDTGIVFNADKNGVTTPKLTQTSLATSKKNFEKFENGLEVVKATDIYKYHLKSQDNKEKKEIGFVIGNNYSYSHEITSVDSQGKEVGVDTYSMISVAYKAIQELSEQNEKLQKRMEKLEKGRKKND